MEAVTLADHYPPTGDDGWPLVDGQAAADYYGVPRHRYRRIASDHGIRRQCVHARRAFYTAADAQRIVKIALGVSVVDLAEWFEVQFQQA